MFFDTLSVFLVTIPSHNKTKMHPFQLYVQGVSLVLGNGVTVIAVQAASTLSVRDALLAIGAAVALFGVCMGLIGRIVTADGQPGALNRLYVTAFGSRAGFARLTQQLVMIAAMPSLARSAFALYVENSKLVSLAFVLVCLALKLWWARALDAFNAATGVLEMTRWAFLMAVLAGVAGVGMMTDVQTLETSTTFNYSGMAALAMTTLYGLAGMEALVDKAGEGLSARALAATMAAVLVTSSLVYVLVPVLVMGLIPVADVQHLQATGNTAALNDVLLRVCLAPFGLGTWSTHVIEAVFDLLVFVSLINGASSLADLNMDCLVNIGEHAGESSWLKRLEQPLHAAGFMTVVTGMCCVSETASGLVGAISALVLVSHLVTSIAFWAVYGSVYPKWCVVHGVTVGLLMTVLLATDADWTWTGLLICVAFVLPLWGVWNNGSIEKVD